MLRSRITVLGARFLTAFGLACLASAAGQVQDGSAFASGDAKGCQPSWLPTFGVMPGVDKTVAACAVFDDGSGPALYVGGAFTHAGNVAASCIAKWNGASWSALGGGIGGTFVFPAVHALAVFDDGSGPALYAGGNFETAGGSQALDIARWDGTSWSVLASGPAGGITGGSIEDLIAFDDGGGPALYACGDFTHAGGFEANDIAKWDGTSWSALGSGMSWLGTANSFVHALEIFDDGGGPALYAGGFFTSAGGVAAKNVAKWNGTTWSALGSGLGGGFLQVLALTVFDDGTGPALVAGGSFTSAGGVPASSVAQWSGTSWSALGGGVSGGVLSVDALTVFDDGSGPVLVAGGDFTSAGGVSASSIARWDGTSWSALGSGTNAAVLALTAFDDGRGPALYAGGEFSSAEGSESNFIARWKATGWSALGSGMTDLVLALTVLDYGGGPALYAGGEFLGAGGVSASHVARWGGTSWSALGSGVNGDVYSLAGFDDGSSPALYAGGAFTGAGGVAASSIARWDGTSWSALGSGMGLGGLVYALVEFDDGSGPALYAGGTFGSAGGLTVNHVARWDGTSWSALGSGTSGTVQALAVFDDGSGPALYVGGQFTSVSGVPANRIAKWDGTSWSALASGMEIAVEALAVFDDGSGPALYAGGWFASAGGVAANNVAKWDGASWSALAGGLDGQVLALAVLDDGSGPALYAGGFFTGAGGVAANRIARWDGTRWSALESGMSDPVLALTEFDDGGGPALYAGGWFSASPAGDSFLAKWGCSATAITTLHGCSGNPATLAALAPSAPLGAPLPLRITGSAALSGLGVLAYGAAGIDGSGCGLPVPGIGELLLALAPAPKTLPSGLLAGGVCELAPPVPSIPALSGVTAYLQGAAVDLLLPQPLEPTNALAVKLGP